MASHSEGKLERLETHFPLSPPEIGYQHREPTQFVCVTDCYFVVDVLDLPFA